MPKIHRTKEEDYVAITASYVSWQSDIFFSEYLLINGIS